MPNYRALAAAVTATLVLTVVASCTDNPPGSTVTPATSTPTTTASVTPTPQPPAVPPAARAATKDGLQAFAEHWVQTKNYMQATGDTRSFLALSKASCTWCVKLAKAYGDLYRAGGYYTGNVNSTISEVQLVNLVAGPAGDIQFRAAIPASTKVEKAGATPQTVKASVRDYTLNARFQNGAWILDSAVWTTVKGES